ncbi:hypothetical protein C8Q80DRAFT_1290767 [Daedaleopsis nitida]|nr:hypothetical protein C8Q80DRAFT_1290767 [Daedaleopsis nitida]
MSRKLSSTVPHAFASAVRSRTPSIARRHAHHAVALKDPSSSNYVPHDDHADRSLYSRRNISRAKPHLAAPLFPHPQHYALSDLERRIAELKEAPIGDLSPHATPSYSEHDLLSMYEDLLAIPSATQTAPVSVEHDPLPPKLVARDVLRATVEALYAHEGPSAISEDVQAQYAAAIAKLTEVLDVLESARADPDSPIGVAVLSQDQWLSLVSVCVEHNDGSAAESVLRLIKRSGMPVPLPALESTMSLYAKAGDVPSAERFLTTYVGPSPPEPLRDLHIKAHIRSLQPGTFPTAALSVLHDYESRGLAAPQQSYTRLVTTLFSIRSTVAEAQAWDLFSHMRYVAHPVPDAYMYTLMIGACASRVISVQPARALDLFAEMTVDKGLPPTGATYNAAIYACARSGEKAYVNEAFRLAKEMLDGHRDAYGSPAFVPDRHTFCALLEGAKRVGDLAKVRWILAEIVAEGLRATRGDVPSAVVVDETIMMHVFHAYAAYKPPFDRAATVLVDRQSADASTEAASAPSPATEPQPSQHPPQPQPQSQPQDASAHSADASPEHPQLPSAPPAPRFTAILPQSHAEVISEARALFARILHDSARAAPSAIFASADADLAASTMPHAFAHVVLTARVLNAFLSVHYVHALFDEGAALYRTLFAALAVDKNAWTHVEALERAARARKDDRRRALAFARDVWADARLVERAYTAMIRVLALTGNAREALQLVRAFFEHYPPSAVAPSPTSTSTSGGSAAAPFLSTKHPLLSTRTALQAARPLVRTLSPTEVPDGTVPPLLSFHELEALHHRLVALGDRAGVGYVKYVCMAYASALRRRKDAVLHAEPVLETQTEPVAGGEGAAAPGDEQEA